MKRILIVLLLLHSAFLFSQEKLQRKLFIDTDSGALEDTGVLPLEDALKTFRFFTEVIVAEQTDILVVEKREESDCIITISVAEDRAGAAGAEEGGDGTEGRSIEGTMLRVEAYDTYFEEEKFIYEYPLKEYSIIELKETFFPELVVRTVEAFPPRDPEVKEVVTERVVEDVEVKRVLKGVVLTLYARAGTRITTKTGDVYNIDETGQLDIELPFDNNFAFRAEHPDYYPEEESILIGREDVEYTLEQVRVRRWGIDAGIRIWAGGLELAGVFYPLPHYVFVSLNLESNVVSFQYIGNRGTPFITPSVSLGVYFRAPEKLLRFALSTGFLTRISFPPDMPVTISPLVTFGIQLPVRVELSPFKRVRFYGEYKPRLIYNTGDDTFITDAWGWTIIPISESFYFNLGSNFVIGTRILL